MRRLKNIDFNNTVTLLKVLTFFISFSFIIWRSLFNNFSVEVLSANSIEIGFIQSVRELPGLLGVGFLLFISLMSGIRLLSVFMIIFGTGILFTGYSDMFHILSIEGFISGPAFNLTLFTLIMSLGFHYHQIGSDSLVMHTSGRIHSAKTLGSVASWGSAGSVIGLILVWNLTQLSIPYKFIYTLIGVSAILIGTLVFKHASGQTHLKAPGKLEFKQKFTLFYILTFLSGSRRQIFVVFAIFLLVKRHSMSVDHVVLLMLANHIVSTWVKKKAGEIIHRFGEAVVMHVDYFLLAFLFLGYALIDNVYALLLLYILDGMLYCFSITVKSYMHKISSDHEISTNVSMGMSINHIAAVLLPFLCGFVWDAFGYHWVFVIGVVIAVLSFASSFYVKKSLKVHGQ